VEKAVRKDLKKDLKRVTNRIRSADPEFSHYQAKYRNPNVRDETVAEARDLFLQKAGNPSGALRFLMTQEEAWLLRIIAHLDNPTSVLYAPPSPRFDAIGMSTNADVLTRIVPTYSNGTGTVVFPTNVLVSHSTRTIGTDYLNLTKTKCMNYTQVTGRCTQTLTLKGNEGAWIWFDPFDMTNPLRINSAAVNDDPNQGRYWQGSLYGKPFSPYGDVHQTGGVSKFYTWTDSPYVYPTDYTMSYLPTESPPPDLGKPRRTGLYPYDQQYEIDVEVGVDQTYLWTASSFLQYPANVNIEISVADNTAFSATGFRVNTNDSCVHRFMTRVENPETGDRGFYDPFVKANRASANWSGSQWIFPTVDTANSQTNEQPIHPSDASPPGQPYCCTGVANWHSLQRCLANNLPVFEVLQGAEREAIQCTLSIVVTVEYYLVPLYLATGMSSRQNLTVPYQLPGFLSDYSLVSSITPVDGGGSMTVGALVPMHKQRTARAHAALHEVPHPSEPIRQITASHGSTPSSTHNFIKDIDDFLEKAVPIGKSIFNFGKKFAELL
jgi:hypothetical protein